MEFFLVYTYTVLSTISGITLAVSTLLLVAGIIWAIVSHIEQDDSFSNFWAKSRWYYVIPVVLALLVPCQKDMETIIGAGLAWKATSSISEVAGIADLPENLVRAMNTFLESNVDKASNNE